jgi:heme/copper-type cytochrome/quinol oxidase subunit 2
MAKKKTSKSKSKPRSRGTGGGYNPYYRDTREVSDRNMKKCTFYTTVGNFVVIATIILLLIIVISAIAIGGVGNTTDQPTSTQENLGIAIWITTGVLLVIAFVVYVYAYYQKSLYCVKMNLNIETAKLSTNRYYNVRGGGNAIVAGE